MSQNALKMDGPIKYQNKPHFSRMNELSVGNSCSLWESCVVTLYNLRDKC